MPTKTPIYKDLVPMEAQSAERVKSAEEFQREILALQQPPKPKDSEPNILDFNKPTFSRIKPKLPDPPPKPASGVSSEIDDDFILIQKEKEFASSGEKDSNASLISSKSAVNLQKSSRIKDIGAPVASTSVTSIKSIKLKK